MLIWFALIIPIVAAIIMLVWFSDKMTWWEVVIPLAASIFFTIIFKLSVEKIQVTDTEYWGGLGIRAEYYEPWTSWVSQTCTRQVPCGTDSKGNTQYCTETYDCSYCDDNGPRWYLVNDIGENFPISEEKYRNLTARWKATPQFVELNRNIHYHFGCGQDGDMYQVFWNRDSLTAEATTTSHWYENRVQAAHTAFDFPEVTDQDKSLYGLYEYPDIDGYQQTSILGQDSIPWLDKNQKIYNSRLTSYLCGKWGPKKEARIWILLFKDKPLTSALMQEAYWKGGNKNELVICIGLSSTDKSLQWVKSFSWTPQRTVLVSLREDIMNTKHFYFPWIYHAIDTNMPQFKRRNFEEFNYVTVDPPMWCIITTYIVTLILTVLLCYWAVTNEFVSEEVNVPPALFHFWQTWQKTKKKISIFFKK